MQGQPPAEYYRTADSVGEKPHDGEPDAAEEVLRRLFPRAFTMVCLGLFAPPAWIVLRISRTPAVAYFENGRCLGIWAIPAIILCAHLLHSRRRAPSKAAVVAALVLPNVIVLWYADKYYVSALDMTAKLAAHGDCASFEGKRALQRSWEAAYQMYMNCIDQTHERTGHPKDMLMNTFRVQDCEEYAAGHVDERGQSSVEAYRRDWAYLRGLEEDHACAGWCYRGQQLWSASGTSRDSCSAAVAQVYGAYVEPSAAQVCSLLLASLGSSAVALVLLGPFLRRRGLQW